MKPLTKIILIAVAVIAVALVGNSWLQSREDRIRLEAQIKADQSVKDELKKSIEAKDAHIAETDQATRQAVQQIAELKAKPASAGDIALELQKFSILHSRPELASVSGVNTSLSQKEANQALPDAPSPKAVQGDARPALTFNEQQAQELRGYYLQCQQEHIQLGGCVQDAVDSAAKYEALAKQKQIAEQERDAAIRVVKGGGFFTRLKRNAKWFLIGGAAGVAVAKGVHR